MLDMEVNFSQEEQQVWQYGLSSFHGRVTKLDRFLTTLKFMFSKKATKIDKISPAIWHYVVSVKSTVKISLIFVAFLENMNFNDVDFLPKIYIIL